jgi:hypothetical protein
VVVCSAGGDDGGRSPEPTGIAQSPWGIDHRGLRASISFIAELSGTPRIDRFGHFAEFVFFLLPQFMGGIGEGSEGF